jgi:hypothetical protein
MEKKQTAVEWLDKELDSLLQLYPSEWEKVNNAIKQALQMEKEQIAVAFIKGKECTSKESCQAAKYYTETYGNQTDRS